MIPVVRSLLLAAFLALGFGRADAAQSPIDQADPSVVVHDQRRPDQPDGRSNRAPTIENANASVVDVGGSIVVGAVRVDGATVVPASAFAPVISGYAGRTLTPADLRTLAGAIADVARHRGYGLATAWIPRQRLDGGILHVVLDEGRIDRIQAQGPAAAVVQRYLAPLAGGPPVRTVELERRLLLAGDIAGVRVGKARLQRSEGHNVLAIATQRDAVRIRILIDNWGTSIVGPLRAQLTVDFNGLLAGDDRLTIGGAATPLQPREFQLVSLGYSRPIGVGGAEIHAQGYYAANRAGGSLSNRDIEGDSAFAGIGVSQAVVRTRTASLWANADLDYLAANQSEQGVRFREDRITGATLSLYGTAGDTHGRLRARVSLRQGLNLLGATRLGGPLASRSDAGGVFTKVEFWASYDRKLPVGFSLGLQAQGQDASGPLLSSEEMGLGGRYFLRGYDYREYSGDKGIAASAELRFDLRKVAPLRGLQLYAYADAGSVGNYDRGYGSGTLASAGGGARVRLPYNLDVGLEVGVPLRHGALPNKHYRPRISFTLSGAF